MEGSGIYDHSIVSAMWKLGGSQELLDTYRKALDAHGMDEKILSPALRFTTSDVAASGANLYPMMTSKTNNRTISLGSPIIKGQRFWTSGKIWSRYAPAMWMR